MAPITAAEEKRQEEKRIKELREFQRGSPANRRCFDCNEMMPQYVCLDFNTFVCTSCSGIHREFAHRVKSLSMSKFTESEVKALKLGGNEAAQKYWRAKHDANFRPHGGTDGERTRNFIRLTYIDRKWVYESPRAETKKDDGRKTSSGTLGHARSKAAGTPAAADDTDDFFGSKSKRTPTPAAAAFDAFSDSTAAGSGFAQFGDFSAFSSNATASAGFADFGGFESSRKSDFSDDFDDFGGAAKSTKGPAPPSSDFGSFKIAPPPGVGFSSVPAPITATSARPTPPNDFMAFSPDKAMKDPFGFDEPPTSATSVGATPFDAFSAPAGASRASSSSSGFDAFGSTAPVPAASDFGGFNATPFDAFGASASAPPSSASSAFDAFGSSSSGGFGADFGAPATASSARSSSGTASAAADQFSAFSLRVSSGSDKVAASAAASSAPDPFSAFDMMDTAYHGGDSRSTGSFGAGTGPPSDMFGAPANHSLPGQGYSGASDPFAFDGQSSGSKSNSFSAPGGGAVNPFQHQHQQQFPPQHQQQFPPQHQQQFPSQHHGNPMQSPAFMQQPGQQQQQQWFGQPQMPPQQQQQQYGQFPMHQQQPFGQQLSGPFQMQHHHQQHQHSGQSFPSAHPFAAESSGGPPPAHAKPAATATVAAVKDPFAALNLGLGSSTSSGTAASNSRSSSMDRAPGSTSGSFSNGSAAAPFHQARQGSAGSGGGFPVAPGSASGSRGSSFNNPPSPAFGPPIVATSSPLSSFAFPPATPAFPAPSQPPPSMAPFSAGQNQSHHDAFADNTFGAFASAPARVDSLKTPTPAASANPFDMF